MASSGCLGCHKVGDNGNTLGPNLTEIGDKLGKDAIARTLVNPTSPMPSYQRFQQENPEQFNRARQVRRLPEERVSGSPGSGTLPDTQVRAMFDRIARVYDRMNSVMTAGMHHRWRRRAAELAQVGPRVHGARRGDRHRRPRDRAGAEAAPR